MESTKEYGLDSDIENIVVGVHPILDELDDGKGSDRRFQAS